MYGNLRLLRSYPDRSPLASATGYLGHGARDGELGPVRVVEQEVPAHVRRVRLRRDQGDGLHSHSLSVDYSGQHVVRAHRPVGDDGVMAAGPALASIELELTYLVAPVVQRGDVVALHIEVGQALRLAQAAHPLDRGGVLAQRYPVDYPAEGRAGFE